MDKVTISAGPLREILAALMGPPHLIRELQVLSNHPFNSENNPIRIVVNEFNAQCEAEKTNG